MVIIDWEFVFFFCVSFILFIIPEVPSRLIDNFTKKWERFKLTNSGRRNRGIEKKPKKYWEVNIRKLH